MEQKTEASQAVDDLDALAKRLDRIHTACCDTRPKKAVGEMIYGILNMSEWNRVRAALKTQPAPTEAPTQPCWSCNKPYTLAQRSYSDGRCPHCDVDIELEDEAPTEAAQGDGPFKFVPWSKESEMIEGWKKAEKARNEAEGEDRYRLADGYLTGTVVSDPNASWIAIRYESMEQAAAAADLLFSMIDRARASAETGGVKP